MQKTIDLLINKEFAVKLKGYDKVEVDDFLDEVIADIEKIQKKYELLLDEKKLLEKNNFELKMKTLDLEGQHSRLLKQIAIEENTERNAETNTTHVSITKPNRSNPTMTNQHMEYSSPKTHDDSSIGDQGLQEKIAKLEADLNSLKNFND